jgi:hypothetical protein
MNRFIALAVALLIPAIDSVAGELIMRKDFNNPGEVTKATMGFRKQTQHKVVDGHLVAIPPKLADKKIEGKWADSTFARVHFSGAPQDYVCKLRWKFDKPKDPKSARKAVAYLDMGHRCVRVTMTPDGTTLLLENHLVGKDSDPPSKVLATDAELKLEPGVWYDVTAETKGNEVTFAINGRQLHGKDPLIGKKPYDTFNLDVNGAGYRLDFIELRSLDK